MFDTAPRFLMRDRYERPDQLLAVFDRMQQFHIEFARDPAAPLHPGGWASSAAA